MYTGTMGLHGTPKVPWYLYEVLDARRNLNAAETNIPSDSMG
jgi:hypothetical protein